MGNLLRKTENGKTITYSYDDLNRLKTTASGNYYQHFFYDDNDNLIRMNSPGVSIVQQYDPADRLISRTATVNGKSGKISYAYNGNDHITRIIYPSGTKVDYTYNTLNQVTRVSGFGGELKNISYYSTGEQNGLLKNYSRDNNQVVTLNWDKRRRMTSAGHPSHSLSYQYDNRGNMKNRSRAPGQTQSFSYDNINRLEIFNGPWDGGSYDYDNRDNRTGKTIGGTATNYGYNRASNRITSQGGTSYGYNGPNITSSGNRSFLYDPFNNMVQVKQGAATIADYIYDAGNRRVFKNANGERIYYHYGQSDQVLSELDGSGSLLFDYIYLGSTLVAKSSSRSGVAVAPWMILLMKD